MTRQLAASSAPPPLPTAFDLATLFVGGRGARLCISTAAFVLASCAFVAPLRAVQVSLSELKPHLVTADGVGTHVTSPGVTAFGVNHDGVADVILASSTSPFPARCSGALLPGGTHVLTAGHCLDFNGNGVADIISGTVRFELASGDVIRGIAGVTLHPSYNGDAADGNDIGVIELSSAAPSAVPRYDIYRGTDEVDLGVDRVKVGYGRSGSGDNGATTGSGTKRAGLNSYDTFADPVLDALHGSPPTEATLLYDFDDGTPAHDALGFCDGSPATCGISLPAGLDDLGAGADEVNAAPGDSGGPTFIEANDTILTLASGANLGAFIGPAIPTQNVALTKDGNNATSFTANYSGDATNAGFTGSFTGDVQDFKIAGVTSAGVGFNADPPDASPGTNNSFGELGIDTRVSSFQAFIDPFLPASFTPFAAQNVPLDFTGGAGNKSAVITIDNLAATSEAAGRGSNDANESETFTATLLDRSEASFAAAVDLDSLNIDFGVVTQNSSPADIDFDIFNLVQTAGFTAGLDLDSFSLSSGDAGKFDPGLSTFVNLAAGSSQMFSASFIDTSQLGSFSATFGLVVSDQNLTGAANGTPLSLTISGAVVSASAGVIPEPATLTMWGLIGLAWMRRRTAQRDCRSRWC